MIADMIMMTVLMMKITMVIVMLVTTTMPVINIVNGDTGSSDEMMIAMDVRIIMTMMMTTMTTC